MTDADPTGLDNWWADPTMNVPVVEGAPPISQDLADDQGFGALCTASTCSHYSASKTNAARAAIAAQQRAEARAAARAAAIARAKAEAKAKAEAAAAHRHCSWYDVVCQVEVHAAQIEEAALILAVAAAVVAVVVFAPEIAIAAASAGLEAAAGGATAGMAATAAAAAGISVAAEGAGLTTLAAGAAVVANVAGAGDFQAGGAACSFAPTTPVLMASGKAEPIGKIKPGDKVESADPATGKEQGGRTVEHIWINHDADLLDVTIDTGHGRPAVVHTTANHPFWDDTTHTWERADHLKTGHHLASTHGRHPVVLKVTVTQGVANRWNLTVQQLHTYYVLVGATPVLVHNCNLSGVYKSSGLSTEELEGSAIQARDTFAKSMSGLSQKLRPTTVTAGYNTETGEYAAGASSKAGCAEVCVINALGGDPSKVRFTSAVWVRPNRLLDQQAVCLFCEARFGRQAFPNPATTFESDLLRIFDK